MIATEDRRRFDDLRAAAETAFAGGDLDDACALFAEAESLALEHGEEDLADWAFCNRCTVLIELDEADAEIPKLKKILLRSRDDRNRWLAAYNTAVAYDLAGDERKAQPYAQRALELSAGAGEPVLAAATANLAGTLATRGSRFEEAEEAYRCGLGHRDRIEGDSEAYYTALLNDNLGYVLLCEERIDEGVALCETSLEALDRTTADHIRPQVLQDLCYGYLLQGALDNAGACGEQALDLAAGTADKLIVKNCLFLLAEIAVRRGDTFRARRYLRELAAYYPEVGVSEEIIDVFLATDLTTAVNLRG